MSRRKHRLLAFAGARPNFVKVAALVGEAGTRDDVELLVAGTGQHSDRMMSSVFLDEFGVELASGPGGLSGLKTACNDAAAADGAGCPCSDPLGERPGIAAMTRQCLRSIERFRPDMVLAIGDVDGTLAASLAASRLAVPLAHVEAGLRCFDERMPEERNRVVVDSLSDLLFASEHSGMENLAAEGREPDVCLLAGNTMVDTLLRHVRQACKRGKAADFGLRRRNYALATVHRQASVDSREILGPLLGSLAEISRNVQLLLVLHPRTSLRIREFGLGPVVESAPGLVCTGPMGYMDFISLLGDALFVLTDSGGVQEEAFCLGVPCLTLRDSTERPSTLAEGRNRLVGVEPRRVVGQALCVLEECRTGTVPGASAMPCTEEAGAGKGRPLCGPLPEGWDGRAAGRILDASVQWIGGSRPG